MPPDQLENGNGFQFTYLGVQKPGSTLIYIPEEKQLKNKLGDLKSGGKTGGSRHPVDEIGFGGMDTRTVDEDEDVDEDDHIDGLNAAAFGLDEGLLQWRDSSHDCALFSNSTHTVSFLSFKPKALRENMHPQLLQHLIENGINIGESLGDLTFNAFCHIY
jgi:hypothetical protein